MISNVLNRLKSIFNNPISLDKNFICLAGGSTFSSQQQTNEVFSEKWSIFDGHDNSEKDKLYAFQKEWYLKLYGFSTESSLRDFLVDKKIIFDAGCGLGYKAAWFAQLAPDSLVIGMDFSEASKVAAINYRDIPNLVFLQGDIASTGFKNGVIDYVSCDQVIMHTENPESTFKELARITAKPAGQLACYFYAKKALPRELLDDYFRNHCIEVSTQELWELSEQLCELGKRLSEINVSINVPEIPLLGIKGGQMDLQRFVYWNFIKCFWNEDLGRATSIATNFDWYSPSNAKRFDIEEVHSIVYSNNMTIISFHSEEACYSGRFGFVG
ncbi:MAG: SAM-dependent methyltransferase [Polynucleobacter sp. 39-45-136]|jgi:SAM-dependent methyltransferase|nr:MAG: SAM-dependent methyltransferase [Polynucleobacter sp. 39-45-136]